MATENRSGLKDFLASISTIKGDLSNITAPPFLLASQSTAQFPSYWAEHPANFVAAAKESDPAKRAVLVLKWFLASLKRQQYAGREPSEGVKKPLNAFLGEVFVANWEDDEGTTRLVSEQVSHHPPITACYLWNAEHGVRAEGFACQSITFSGSVNIKQMGYAIIHLDKFQEDYLIPLPDVKVTGLLTGSPYPELDGTYSIVSSSGYIAEIDFSGKKFLGLTGKKNSFAATVYELKDGNRSLPLYLAEGTWSEEFTIHDEQAGADIETYTYDTHRPAAFQNEPLERQDPWESKKAWNAVTHALDSGRMQAAADEKSKIEEGQRHMRAQEEKHGETWKPIFFASGKTDPVYEKLLAIGGMENTLGKDFGSWKFKFVGSDLPQRPFHGNMTPEGTADEAPAVQETRRSNEVGLSKPTIVSNGEKLRDVGKASRGQDRQDWKPNSPYSQQALDPRVDGNRPR